MIEREKTLPTQPDLFIKLLMSKLYGHGQFDIIYPIGDLKLQGPYSIGDTLIIDATGPVYREYSKVMQFRTIQVAEWQTKVTAKCRDIPDLRQYFIDYGTNY